MTKKHETKPDTIAEANKRGVAYYEETERNKVGYAKTQDQPSTIALRHASERSPTEYSGIDTSPKASRDELVMPPEEGSMAQEWGPSGPPEPDYYQINYLHQPAPEAMWFKSELIYPTRETADAKAEDLKARGALSVRVTPRHWGA